MRWSRGNPAVAALVVFAALFVVLLDVPENPGAVIFSGAAYVPLVAVFVSLVKSEFLPYGWGMLGLSGGAMLQVYLWAAALVALAIDYPLIAYAIFGRVLPMRTENGRSLVPRLVVASTLLLAAGALFAYVLLTRIVFVTLNPYFLLLHPLIGATDLYLQIFQGILIIGTLFLVAGYAVVSRFRTRSTQSVRA